MIAVRAFAFMTLAYNIFDNQDSVVWANTDGFAICDSELKSQKPIVLSKKFGDLSLRNRAKAVVFRDIGIYILEDKDKGIIVKGLGSYDYFSPKLEDWEEGRLIVSRKVKMIGKNQKVERQIKINL